MTTATLGFGGTPLAAIKPAQRRPQQRSSERSVPAPRLRLTQRGRGVLTVLAATPLVIAALVFALNGGGAAASLEDSDVAFEYVTVASGQSLWQLAGEIAPQADPRDVIAQVVELNALTSQDVYAGQELAVPLEYSH